MDCTKARELTARTLSGNASAADDDVLRAHAAACPPCADALTRARKVWVLMGRLPEPRPLRTPAPPAILPRRRVPVRLAAAAAAAILLVAAGLLFRRPADPPVAPPPPAPLAAEAEAGPLPPSPEQVRVEQELETVVRETQEVRVPAPAPAPEPEPAPPAPPKKREPLVLVPAPEPEPPAPLETAKTDPPPAPEPAPKPAEPARDTLPVAATLDRAEGQVVATVNGRTLPVTAPFRLTDADGLATLGKNSQAVLAYPDGTRLVLGGDSAIGRVLRRTEGGAHIDVLQGVVAAQVAKRASGDALSFLTPNAEARVLGTRLILLVGAASTRLDVKEGRVKLIRTSDGAAVEVGPDHYAVAAKGTSLVSRGIPGPKIALREDFDRGRWSPVWAPQLVPGQGVSIAPQAGALVLGVRSVPPVGVTPDALTNDPGSVKKALDQVHRVATLASKKDWARAGALETRGSFAFSSEAPLRVRLNAWTSHAGADRVFWIGLNRGLPGQGVSLERRGQTLRLWIDGAATALWEKELPCAKEWESLELWLDKERIALRRNGLTVAVEAHPLKAKAVQLSIGTCAKAELGADEETRLDDLEVAWLTKNEFQQISK